MVGRTNARDWARVFFVPFFTVLIGASAAPGAVIYVDASAAGAGDGSSWCNAFGHVQNALAVAQPGDEIRVAAGTYMPDGAYRPPGGAHLPGTGDREATFALKSGVALLGGFAGCGAADPNSRDLSRYETILSGDLNADDMPLTSPTTCQAAGGTWYEVVCDRVLNNGENSFHVVTSTNNDSTAVLDGFTVSGGNANGPAFGAVPESQEQGAGINIYFGTPTTRNCLIIRNRADNHAALNDHGGATIDNCEFRHNFATRWGGALHNHEGVTTTISNTSFIENATAGTGGGGGAVFAKGTTTLKSCMLENNISATNGGAIYADQSESLGLTGCMLRGNRAGRWGGALYLTGVACSVTGSAFESNKADDDRAGAVYVQTGSFQVSETIFRENVAPEWGGALYFSGDSCYVTNSVFESNTAYYGGAVFVQTGSFDGVRTVFRENRANLGAGGGGAMLVWTALNLTECRFERNGAGYYGGALWLWRAGAATLEGCEFQGNTVPHGAGGAILANVLDPAGLRITNSVFAGNAALSEGGAVAVSQVAHVIATNCTFAGNASGLPGGGLRSRGAPVTVANCILWNNSDDSGTQFSSQVSTQDAPMPEISYSVVNGWTDTAGGVGNTGDDPQFLRPPSHGGDGWGVGDNDDFGDLRLMPGSPAIDAGDNSALSDSLVNDIAGNPRFVDDPLTPDTGNGTGAIVDMGALEFGNDCNGNGIHDPRDIAAGVSADLNANGLPDECEAAPVIGRRASRYLVFTPLPTESLQPVALRVTPLDQSCPDAYVQANGSLASQPAFRIPSAWGTVGARGREIVPGAAYEVRVEYAKGVSSNSALATTARWGDTAGQMVDGQWDPPDGMVTIGDALACIDRFRGMPGAPPAALCDVDPEVPDGLVLIADILRIIEAFLGRPYPFATPVCP